jgi:galactose mutarotase-like enzyme
MEEIVITHAASGTRASVVPERGGMVTSLEVGRRAVLYLDPETLRDPTKNVRGGIPLLFPSPGKLENDAWAHGTLEQHGFARNLPWAIVKRGADTLTLRLTSSDATQASYPFRFRFDVTYVVDAGGLRLEAQIANVGDQEMPFGFGTHPYFSITKPASFRIASDATRAFDNVTKREIAFAAPSLSLGESEIDLHLIDHSSASMRFEVDGTPITIEAPEHRRWVIWSVPGKPFVCVEPWTCPGNALNTGTDLVRLAAGATCARTQSFRVGG